MYWWRKTAYTTLRQVGAAAAKQPHLAGYSQYCALRETGLRRQSLAVLEEFITEAKGWAVARQRQFAEWMCLVGRRFEDTALLRPHPLQEWLVEVCTHWGENTTDAAPMCWLGLLTHTLEPYHEAVRRDPRHEFALVKLIQHYTNILDWATDALPEYFWGVPEEVLDDAAPGLALLENLPNPEKHTELVANYHRCRRLALDWLAAQEARGRQSYWSPYEKRMQAKGAVKKDDYD